MKLSKILVSFLLLFAIACGDEIKGKKNNNPNDGPSVTITQRPTEVTNNVNAQFFFRCDFVPQDAQRECFIYCSLDDREFASCENPVWFKELAEGEHRMAVTAADEYGNNSTGEDAYTWYVDTTLPETSVQAALPFKKDGVSPSDRATFELSCLAESCAYECSLDGAEYSACAMPVSYENLSEGHHSLKVITIDEAGNKTVTPETFEWTVDTLPPEARFTTIERDVTNDTSREIDFSCNEAACSYQCSFDGALATSCMPPLAYADLQDGPHTLRVIVYDKAGNQRVITTAWAVDTVPAQSSVSVSPGANTNSTSAGFRFACNEGSCTFRCQLDSGSVDACDSGIANYNNLSQGEHAFNVYSIDQAHNLEPGGVTVAWIVDTHPPETTRTTASAELTNVDSATFEYVCSETGCTYECRLDGGSYDNCNGGSITYNGLTDAVHTVYIRAIDKAGNFDASATTVTWKVDTTAPQTVTSVAPAPIVYSSDVSVVFACNESNCVSACSLDGESFADCASPVYYAGLTDGTHTMAIRQTDEAGNGSTQTTQIDWVVDLVPDTTITKQPPLGATSSTAVFEFECNEASCTYECSLASEEFGLCVSPKVYTGLSEAMHYFAVRAVDSGNKKDASPAGVTWYVDATLPDTFVAFAPASSTYDTEPKFGVNCIDATPCTYTCELDGRGQYPCGVTISLSGLGDGLHQLEVITTDIAGNTEATGASISWWQDTTAPSVTITDMPSAVTSNRAGPYTFEFVCDEPGCSYQCRLNSSSFTSCDSGHSNINNSGGVYTIEVFAVDAASNQSELVAYEYVVTMPIAQAGLDYLDNGDSTVTDLATGLMWEQKTNENKGHHFYAANAIAYCDNLTLATHTDWRLPERVELMSLWKAQPGAAMIDGTAFIPRDEMYYSKTLTVYGYATISFAWSGSWSQDDTYNAYLARCVR